MQIYIYIYIFFFPVITANFRERQAPTHPTNYVQLSSPES